MSSLEFVRNSIIDGCSDDDRSFMIDQCFVSRARETLMTIALAFDAEAPRTDGLAIMRKQGDVLELVHGFNPALAQEISRFRHMIGAAIGSRKNGRTFVWTFEGPAAHDACYAAVKLHAVQIVRGDGPIIEVASGQGTLRPFLPSYRLLDQPQMIDLLTAKEKLTLAAHEIHCRKLKNMSATLDSVSISAVVDDGSIYGINVVPIEELGLTLTTRHERIGFELSGTPGFHWPAVVTIDLEDAAMNPVMHDNSARVFSEIADSILIHKERVIFHNDV